MATIACQYQPRQVEAVILMESNYQAVCDFISGHHPQKADNPTMARGKYFGVFVETRYGRQLARIGDYIVKVGELQYRVFNPEEFRKTFTIIENKT